MEAVQHVAHVGFRFGRVDSRRAQDRAAAQLDAIDILDAQGPDVGNIPLHEPLKTIVDADDLHAMVDRFNGHRADHAVNTRRRTAADEQGQTARIRFTCHALDLVYRIRCGAALRPS